MSDAGSGLMHGPVLVARGVCKRFGATRALDAVTVGFAAGEVHALMGENGAGKTTLGKVIAGLQRADDGVVEVRAGDRFRALRAGSVEDAYAAGVRIVHQELAQCPSLTVAENLCLHSVPRRGRCMVDGRAMRGRAQRLLAGLEPGIDPRAELGDLSPGHRQVVQIAAALDDRGGGEGGGNGSGARVIVFDEPTSSLSAAEVDRLLVIVRRLARDGIAVVYISHRMGEIFAACDRVTVLRDGQFVATSRVAEVDEPALVEQMIGRRLEAASARARGAGGGVLRVEDVRSPGKLAGVTLTVAAGEIVGIGGLVGAGRSELMDAVFGLDRAARGSVWLAGKRLKTRSPRASVRAGMRYVPEDRKLQGLFFQLDLRENLVMPVAGRLARGGVWRRGRAERALVAEKMRSLRIKAASMSAGPGTLSGGNQQKALIARWMEPGTRVLLLDEPTRGIDVGTKAEIHRLIREAADGGVAVVLVSSEMPELLALADRVVVLRAGTVAGELRGAEMTQAGILKLATGVG